MFRGPTRVASRGAWLSMGVMLIALGVALGVVAVAVAIWLGVMALGQIRQLRSELDETQRQLNEAQRQLDELKVTASAVPVPPPPLPRSRSAGLEDLREELRAAHREEAASEE
jgi:hypothetical protein